MEYNGVNVDTFLLECEDLLRQVVTDVSGRGAGMDAVKSQIDALRDELALSGELSCSEMVVNVQYDDERVGLVVDRVLGRHQTVIQSLGRAYREIEVVSGATITGDGRVAFVLNIDGIVRRARLSPTRAIEGVCA